MSPFRGRGPFQCPLLGLKGDTSSRTPFWGALDMVGKHTSVETTPVFRGTSVPFLVSNRTLEEKAILWIPAGFRVAQASTVIGSLALNRAIARVPLSRRTKSNVFKGV